MLWGQILVPRHNVNERQAGGRVMYPPSTDQASWVGSEGQPLQSGVLSVASLAQTPFLVVSSSAGNLSAADYGCVCPLFTLTLPPWGVHFRAAMCHSWLKEFVSQQEDKSASALV